MLKRIAFAIALIVLSLAQIVLSLFFFSLGVLIEVVSHAWNAGVELLWLLPTHLFKSFARMLMFLGEGFQMLFSAPFPEAYIERKQKDQQEAKEEAEAREHMLKAEFKAKFLPALRKKLDEMEKE